MGSIAWNLDDLPDRYKEQVREKERAAKGSRLEQKIRAELGGDAPILPAVKTAKYGNKRTVADGIRFDSLAELRRYRRLKQHREDGTILFFLVHPRFHFPDGSSYTADFLIHWTDGLVTVEDVKGVETQIFKRNLKAMAHHYPNVKLLVLPASSV